MSASPSSVSPSFVPSDSPFPLPAQVTPLAAQYHLGSLSQTFRTKGRGQAIGGGIAVICFAAILLLIGRVAGITGTGLFLTSAICVIATIVWMIKAGGSTGQRVDVFPNGLVVQTGQDTSVVVRWGEILSLSSQTPMTLTTKNGKRVVLQPTLQRIDELTKNGKRVVLQPTLQRIDELKRIIQREVDRLHGS